jgi:hypothetical protein
MLVKVLSFGTNWWSRVGRDADDPYRLTRHAAYYNSTGVRCGSKVRRHWIVPGLIRFNGVSGFDPRSPHRSLRHTFLCSRLDFLFGGNRLLLKSKVSRHKVPDWYLVVVAHELHGAINLNEPNWRSGRCQVIAASRLREMQEVMLLMKAGDWVKTGWGFWQLSLSTRASSDATLELRGVPLAA